MLYVKLDFFLSDLMCLGFCSCFLLAMKDDSIEGIYDTLKQCALISKSAGGIGLAVSCIRSTGSYIAGVSIMTTTRSKSSRYRGTLLYSETCVSCFSD